MLPTPLRVLFVCRCTSGFCAASLTQTCWFVCLMCGWKDGWKNLWQGEYEDEKRRGRRWKCCFSHTSSLCLCVSVSLPVFFYFHPTFHPHAWCPLPECQGSVYVHTKLTGKSGLWGHTHPSMQTHPNLSLSFFFLSFWSLSGSIFASQKQQTPRRQSSLTQTAVSE